MIHKMKYMIWDFDGTLVDTYPVMAKSLVKTLEEHGIRSSYDEVYKQLKVSLSEAIAHFAKDDKELIKSIRLRFYELESMEDPKAYEVFPDAIEVLEHLKGEGVTHFILTHRNATTFKIMQACGMTEYIKDTVISDDGFKRKPDPEAFLHLIDKHKLEKEYTLSIGDRLFDIQAGKNAGIHGCLILDAYNDDLKGLVDISVQDRKEILKLYLSK